MDDHVSTVVLIYGGRSPEHEVSLRSAASVYDALRAAGYEVIPVLITRGGMWYLMPSRPDSFHSDAKPLEENRVMFPPDPTYGGLLSMGATGEAAVIKADMIFPVLHGAYGEDGTLQGVLEMANTPYVGCGVLASAVGMDKVLMKAAFRASGLAVGPYFWFLRSEWENERRCVMDRFQERRLPVYVKPANLGSSVGISRVERPEDFSRAVELALSYDRKILVEDGIVGRELEVSVLGNDAPMASLAGEIISQGSFYDYEEKYVRDTAQLIIPAKLSSKEQELAASTAIQAFRAVDGSGMARVDMFLTREGEMVVNEINTIPGFTSISMYPKLWEVSGVPFPELVKRLIELAVERHRQKQLLKTDR
ncbi:MAG: D-alanine--D-alanine ligase family protein [Desulfomonilaceae bacterium]